MGQAPHVEEILAFYVGLLEIQAVVDGAIAVEHLLALVRSGQTGPPRLLTERLPVTDLLPQFDDFLSRVEAVGTDVIAERSRALLAATAEDRGSLLRAELAAGSAGPAESDFHARAFLEPVLTALAATDLAGRGGKPHQIDGDVEHLGRDCPTCSAAPVVAFVRDEPDALGARSLVCSLCATEWRFARLTCVYCGEQDADHLMVHEVESVEHVRIDECATCKHYIKTVDLRRHGGAVPVADEVATVELDLWAGERGLTKIRVNVLGL